MTITDKLLKMRAGIPFKYKQERWVTEQEGMLIRDLVALQKAQSYVESGTANGYSALWAASGFVSPLGRVYTLDPCDRPKLWTPEFGCEALADKIEYIQDGFENLEAYSDRIQHPAVYFIDGDHGRQAVLRDWAAIKPILQKGELVIFHDLNEIAVQKAFNIITKETPASQCLEFKTKRLINCLVYEDHSNKLEAFLGDFNA